MRSHSVPCKDLQETKVCWFANADNCGDSEPESASIIRDDMQDANDAGPLLSSIASDSNTTSSRADFGPNLEHDDSDEHNAPDLGTVECVGINC